MPNIIVSTEIDGEHLDVGDLFFTPGSHGTHSVRFTYDREFIRRGWSLDQELYLDNAPHQLRGMPLSIEDSSPDGWGQMLLQRAERKSAREEERDSVGLTPDLVLLAASDATRQGALRYRTEQNGPYLGQEGAVPSTLELATLLAAADKATSDTESPDWHAFKALLDAGSSALGGARPKAAVLDESGQLWLAKFPMKGDQTNVPLWELVALDIAERAGLNVPERRLVTVGGQHVLLVRRFDRSADGARLHYISTRTLLGARELGTVADYGGRRGIARRLATTTDEPKVDLPLLWKQAALNILVNNTDNHLRNHGLLRNRRGWRLAPVFDLDPNPDTGSHFNTHFGDAAYRGSALPGLFKIAADCNLDQIQATRAFHEVHDAIDGWDSSAQALGATTDEIDLLSEAFTGMDMKIEQFLATR